MIKQVLLCLTGVGSLFGILLQQNAPAIAALPAQSQVLSIQCNQGFNQVNQPAPSWQFPTSTDPATFILF
jgi:hypothetical protein